MGQLGVDDPSQDVSIQESSNNHLKVTEIVRRIPSLSVTEVQPINLNQIQH